MERPIDLTGQRFGRWTVLKRQGNKFYGDRYGSTSFPIWLCRCDCGTEALVLGNNLKSGRTKSCGCLRDELARKRRKEECTTRI